MDTNKKDKKIEACNDLELKEERKKAYSQPESQTLLRFLIKNGDGAEITPVYDPNLGFVYEINDESVGDNLSPEKIVEFLNRLSDLKILQKSFFDSVSACPNCGSTAMTLHFHCIKCKNHNLLKTNLTEHIPCGTIVEREKFVDGKCPKCGEVLQEENFREMGRWYTCRNCNEKFEHPEIEIICRKCNKKFSIEQSKIVEVPKFSMNLAYKKEVKQNIINFDKIIDLLKSYEFEIFMPGVLVGQKSGVSHQFTLVAKKIMNDIQVTAVLDHAVSETEVGVSPLIVHIYKTSEINVDLPIFLAINKVSEEAKKIIQGHNILLLENSTETKENLDKLKNEIEKTIKAKIHPHLQVMASDDENTKGIKNYESEIKPQLFNPISELHQTEKSSKSKKFRRFMRSFGGNSEEKKPK
ncbi:MAG: hypothetical protein JXA91_07525 [Candidatus Thermoplasmatota archaeon]|nr:hypothetical protein [Candidatus Thermoplasmatota archaeon]